jgi:hypothetical protein
MASRAAKRSSFTCASPASAKDCAVSECCQVRGVWLQLPSIGLCTGSRGRQRASRSSSQEPQDLPSWQCPGTAVAPVCERALFSTRDSTASGARAGAP